MHKVIFVNPDGSEKIIEERAGLSILDIARKYDLDLEGACEGSLACSTCHVILDEIWYQKLEPPTAPEEDMLDFAFAVTPTSRLGCQIILTAELDGIRLRIPYATRNIR